jgi:hypothetical protein
MSRHTYWRFLSLLSVHPDLAQCITIAINESDDVVKRIVSSQLIHAFRPDHFNIEVRYTLFDLTVTVIQLEGYVQTSKPIDVYILQRWLGAEWSPIGGQCCRSPAYQIFREPHPDYRHLSLYGNPALHKGGRP